MLKTGTGPFRLSGFVGFLRGRRGPVPIFNAERNAGGDALVAKVGDPRAGRHPRLCVDMPGGLFVGSHGHARAWAMASCADDDNDPLDHSGICTTARAAISSEV